jgi:hypothetical protein
MKKLRCLVELVGTLNPPKNSNFKSYSAIKGQTRLESSPKTIELSFEDYSLKYGQITRDVDQDQRPLKKGRFVDEGY